MACLPTSVSCFMCHISGLVFNLNTKSSNVLGKNGVNVQKYMQVFFLNICSSTKNISNF